MRTTCGATEKSPFSTVLAMISLLFTVQTNRAGNPICLAMTPAIETNWDKFPYRSIIYIQLRWHMFIPGIDLTSSG